MIVIRMELWPKGAESLKRDLGVAHIVNVGGDGDLGNYEVTLFKAAEYSPKGAGGIWRRGVVTGFPRSSKQHGPWDLLFRALKGIVGPRNRA